jgi:hypothetical protein
MEPDAAGGIEMPQQTMDARRKPMPLNGVDTPQLFATINAVAEKFREIVEQSKARSAVFDVLTNGLPVEVEVNAG